MRSKNTQFFGQKFPKKSLKMLFWPVFIQNLASGAENLAKQDLYSALGRLGNSFWWTLKKSTKYLIFFFENPLPPLEKKPRSAPGSHQAKNGMIIFHTPEISNKCNTTTHIKRQLAINTTRT